MDVPVNGPPMQQQDNGGLQFDEDLRDLPQQVEAARPPPPPAPQPNLPAQFPSVLAAPAQPHTTLGPAPGIPVNRAPEQLPALTPMNADGTPAPPKRPRGRPRKIPGTESRGGAPGQIAQGPKPRGRPKGSRGRGARGRGRGGRGGRGGKRSRMSSDEDDFEGDGSETDEEERAGRRGRGRTADDDDDDDDEERVVDLNREVDDDFGEGGRLAATTKFGRKISKPKSFVPTNRPTIHRKKRQATAATLLPPVLDANLMCEVCRGGHSPENNKLVICDSCTRGWHQLCHSPTIQPEVVDSPAAWFCIECDAKIAAQRKSEDVTDETRGWTSGKGEEKKVEGAEELKKPAEEGAKMEGVIGENGELVVGAEAAVKVEQEPETNLQKEDEYSEKVKREWLESLPMKTLIGYVLSVEKKFAPLVSPGTTSLPIWPPALPALLHQAAVARQQEAADRERKLELEAEELAAAQGILLSSAMGTPAPGESQPASEVGTPLGFEQFGVEAVGARTAASRRAELQAQAQAEQQQQQHQQQQQQHQPVASTSAAAPSFAPLQGYPPPSNGHQQQHVPPFHRPPLQPVSALSAASPGLSSISPAGSPAPVADIPVGGSSVGGARATYGAYPPGYAQQQQQQQLHAAAAAAAALQYNPHAGAQYANQFATGGAIGAGPGVGGTPDWAAGGAGMGRQGSGQTHPTALAGPSQTAWATTPVIPLPPGLSTFALQHQQQHQSSPYQLPNAPFNPPRPVAPSVPGHPAGLPDYTSPGLKYAGPPTARLKKPVAYADTSVGRQFRSYSTSSTSRLPPPPQQPLYGSPSSGALPGSGEGKSLFLSQQPRVSKTFVHLGRDQQQRQQQTRAWTGYAAFDDSSNRGDPPPTRQPHQPYPPPPNQQYHQHPNPYPCHPAYPTFLPEANSQQQHTPSSSFPRSSSSVLDVTSPEPERRPAPPSGPLPPGFHPPPQPPRDPSPELRADMGPIKPTFFQPRDPEAYDSRSRREPITYGAGRAGWQSAGFNDDSGPSVSGSRGGRGSWGRGGSAHQAAPPPQRQRTSFGGGGGGSGAGAKMLSQAVKNSVSMENTGSRAKKLKKGKEKAAIEDDEDEMSIQSSQPTQSELMRSLPSFYNRNSHDDSVHLSPSTSYASLPTHTHVSSSNFHAQPHASSSKRVIQQDDPFTTQELEGQRIMEEQRAKGTKEKGKGKGGVSTSLNVKGAAKKKNQTEVLDLASSSEEESQKFEEDDPIEDVDELELDGRINGPRTAANGKKHPRLIFNHDDPRADQSSPDPLSKRGVDVQSKIGQFEALSGKNAPKGGQKKLAANLQPRKRPSDGGSLTNQDDPPPAGTSAMAPPAKAKVPRAAQQAVKAGQQSAGGGIFSIEIHAPMFGRRGIPLDSSQYAYTLKANMRGNQRMHKITLTRKCGGEPPEDVFEFKLDDVTTIDWHALTANPHTPSRKQTWYGFRLKNDWDSAKWEEALASCEMHGPRDEKEIHLVYQEALPKETSTQEKAFHEAMTGNKDYKEKLFQASPSKAEGLLKNYYRVFNESVEHYRKIEKRRSTNASSAQSTSGMKQSSLSFERHATRDSPPIRLSLVSDVDGDLVHPATATRSSNRASTSQLAAPHNQEKAHRLRRGSRANYLNQPEDDSDGEPEVQAQRAKAEPEPYAADEIVLEYPLERAPGQASVSLNYGDTKRLKDDEFLNDTLIEFGLKRAIDQVKDREKHLPQEQQLAPNVHIFNSFFFKQLSSGKGTGDKRFENGYKLVEKWTKKVNLFDKKYIVVPINEHLHWYLAIIVNPAAILRPPKFPPGAAPQPIRKSGRAPKTSSRASEGDITAETVSLASTSCPGSPEQVKSRFFSEPGKPPQEQQPNQEEEDVEMEDPEQEDEEERKSRETKQEQDFLAAVVQKEGTSVLQGSNGDAEMLRHSGDETDNEVTAARPGVEGGGPKRAADVVAPSSGLDAVMDYSSDNDSEPSTAEEVADSQDQNKPPPSTQSSRRTLAQDGSAPITLDESDDEEEKKAPGGAEEKAIQGKEKAREKEGKDEDGDVAMAAKDDDRASDTTREGGDDSDDAVQKSLLVVSSIQAQAGSLSSSAAVNNTVPPGSQQQKPSQSAPRAAVPIVPSMPPGGETPQRPSPTLQPAKQTETLVDLDLNQILQSVQQVAQNPQKDNECYILMFDSLEATHEPAVKHLRHYLVSEAKSKLKKKDDQVAAPEPDEIFRIDVKVPKQPNYCDCGLYLLHFVETFLANPEHVLSMAIALNLPANKKKRGRDGTTARIATLAKLWDDDVAHSKRAVMRDEVRAMMDRYLKEIRPQLLEAQAKEEQEKQEERRKRKEERAKMEMEGADPATQAAIAASLAQRANVAPDSASPTEAPDAPEPAGKAVEQEEPPPQPKHKGRKGRSKATTPVPEVMTIASDDESMSPSPKKSPPSALHPPPSNPPSAQTDCAAEPSVLDRSSSLAEIVNGTEQPTPSSPVAKPPSVGQGEPQISMAQASTAPTRRATYGPPSPTKSANGENGGDKGEGNFFDHAVPEMAALSPTRAITTSDLPLPPPSYERLPSPSLRRPRSSTPAASPPPSTDQHQAESDRRAAKKARRASPGQSSSSSSAQVDTTASESLLPFSAPMKDIEPKGRASLAGKGKKVVGPPLLQLAPSGFAEGSDEDEQEPPMAKMDLEGEREGDVNSSDTEPEPEGVVLVSPAKGFVGRPAPTHRAYARPPTPPTSSKRRTPLVGAESSAPSSTTEGGDYEPSSPPTKKHKGKGKARSTPAFEPSLATEALATDDSPRKTATASGATHTRFSTNGGQPAQSTVLSRIGATLRPTPSAEEEEDDDDDREVVIKARMELPASNQQAGASSAAAPLATRRTTRSKTEKEAKEADIVIDDD
ncbi:hypothetical protein JCM11251_001442 [Rhodosporidiobolus azoricus]